MDSGEAPSNDAVVTAATKPAERNVRSDTARYVPDTGPLDTARPKQPGQSAVDWEDPDMIVVACPCCPCSYYSALSSLIVWTVINLALFAITPLACTDHGWLYWNNALSVTTPSGTFIVSGAATLQVGWKKGTATFLNGDNTEDIKTLLAFNGTTTAEASQALGIVCGSLSVVSMVLCCVYLALFAAMFSPTNRKCWRFIHAFGPTIRVVVALVMGILMFTFAFAFFGEAADQWNDFWDDAAAAYGVPSLSNSTTTLWPTYSWFFFLFGSITWPLIGMFAAMIPYPSSPAVTRPQDPLAKA